jgi:hypothetical protein
MNVIKDELRHFQVKTCQKGQTWPRIRIQILMISDLSGSGPAKKFRIHNTDFFVADWTDVLVRRQE